jgi:hypothetical protein
MEGYTMSVEHKPHSSDLFEVRREHQHRTHGGRVNFIQDCETCNAIKRLEEQLQAERREEWREGVVNVLDHEGNYLGCIGSETWAWTLGGGERTKEQHEVAQNEIVEWRREAVAQQERYLGLKEQLEAFREFFDAHWMVDKGVTDFDLHGEAVERLHRAFNAVYTFHSPEPIPAERPS